MVDSSPLGPSETASASSSKPTAMMTKSQTPASAAGSATLFAPAASARLIISGLRSVTVTS